MIMVGSILFQKTLEKDASLTFVVEARQVGNVNEIVSPHCDINFSFFG